MEKKYNYTVEVKGKRGSSNLMLHFTAPATNAAEAQKQAKARYKKMHPLYTNIETTVLRKW